MSETIQKSKYVTVQEFMPLWTKYMELPEYKQDDFMEKNDLFSGLPTRCLVGEAHGFRPLYYDCGFCRALSVGDETIEGITYKMVKDNLRNFYTFKEGLYNHFMERHPEKLLRKGVPEWTRTLWFRPCMSARSRRRADEAYGKGTTGGQGGVAMSRDISLKLIRRCIEDLQDGEITDSAKVARIMYNLVSIETFVMELEDPKETSA